ncbi:glycosyltransferase family 2 protein [Thalassococcus lentus]|uniref:Glycosyltransferase family 2 protein n=1 Tax=Thalassococcus lentus TaxID=1210524 RepID=A0ABT4XQZ7_9RHOB|nr:glycosyltransferase family 2 protein [Thalassococcus lentus]MDA7424379.1 glycosyltransferase family 2 protein [Thalassococcus lentus]
MKICALTMVHRDYWALSRWYAHHGALIGPENLFVIAHGADPRIQEICPKASVLTIPRETFEGFDKVRGNLLNGIMGGLLGGTYDIAIRTDADELVCFDPDRYESLQAVVTAHDAPVLTALGFDLVEMPEDATLDEGSVFAQRSALAFSGHYSKAVIARRAVDFQLHGTRVAPRRVDGFPFVMPRGLYLAHLKYANGVALDDSTQVREAVGQSGAKGAPGAGWSEASRDRAEFISSFEQKKEVDWDRAETQAYEALSVKPARLPKFNLVKARALKMPLRTRLPQRFSGQG